MNLAGGRITLNPRPVRRAVPALEVAMLGHCPGGMRPDRLLRLTDAVEEIRQYGFGKRLDALKPLEAPAADHLPIPLRSLAEFDDIFPNARRAETLYESRLAGKEAWLPQAVEDFFANGGEKLWVIPVPEKDGAHGFFPRPDTLLHDTDTLAGLATAFILLDVGLVAFPDLERLQIPARLPDIPRVRLDNPSPEFIPCSQSLDDDIRERRSSGDIVAATETLPVLDVLREILGAIGRHRPDMQCLFTLPLAHSYESESPAIDADAIEMLEAARKRPEGAAFRHVQLLFPYLKSVRYSLRSPAGIVAGLQAAAARQQGIWRSVAGMPMYTDGKPYPAVSLADMIQLRDSPGVGVLQYRSGQLRLDDERLAAPALHPDDYLQAEDLSRFDGFRSAEVARFIGFLLRQLKSLGESLVFGVDVTDPRPRIVLERFFLSLFRQGALRGALPEEAFSIRPGIASENSIAYDIEIAPAFPIDHVTLTFVNRSGAWQVEAVNV